MISLPVYGLKDAYSYNKYEHITTSMFSILTTKTAHIS